MCVSKRNKWWSNIIKTAFDNYSSDYSLETDKVWLYNFKFYCRCILTLQKKWRLSVDLTAAGLLNEHQQNLRRLQLGTEGRGMSWLRVVALHSEIRGWHSSWYSIWKVKCSEFILLVKAYPCNSNFVEKENSIMTLINTKHALFSLNVIFCMFYLNFLYPHAQYQPHIPMPLVGCPFLQLIIQLCSLPPVVGFKNFKNRFSHYWSH